MRLLPEDFCMKPIRSLLALLLVGLTTFLTGCGGDMVQAPPTYTPEKIAAIDRALVTVEEVRDRLPELEGYVNKSDWNNVGSFLHGPLGGLRATLGYLDRSLLLEKDQDIATELAESLFTDIERLDAASSEGVPSFAKEALAEIEKDFEAYLNYIPREPDSDA
jgi:photosystem II protein PsbQ